MSKTGGWRPGVSIFISGESYTLNKTEKNQYLFLVSIIFFKKSKDKLFFWIVNLKTFTNT